MQHVSSVGLEPSNGQLSALKGSFVKVVELPPSSPATFLLHLYQVGLWLWTSPNLVPARARCRGRVLAVASRERHPGSTSFRAPSLRGRYKRTMSDQKTL